MEIDIKLNLLTMLDCRLLQDNKISEGFFLGGGKEDLFPWIHSHLKETTLDITF